MRLAEVIGALTLAADVSNGLAVEKGLRTVLVAMRLSGRLVDEREATSVYWVSLLRFVGCVGFAPEQAGFGAGDDNALRRSMAFADMSRPVDMLRHAVQGYAPETPLWARAKGLAKFIHPDVPRRYAKAHCETAVFFARSLGMSDETIKALDVSGERFDGQGVQKIGGDALPWAARISEVADALELFSWTGGLELARQVLQARRGRMLDPALVDAALSDLPSLVQGFEGSVWDDYLASEPTPRRQSSADAERGCVALGRFSDLKSHYTISHSHRVATIAEAAGQAAGLSPQDCGLLKRAGAVHDLGRVAVATGTWDKRGALNAIEWQRVRSHSHHTDVILRSAGLSDLAEIAGSTHERGQGAGYHRGISLDTMPLLAKIIAAADVMAALGEERPHRPAQDDNRATKVMRELVEQGALDARAAQAVLEARGIASTLKRAWPGGLSEREVEVVRLVAVGRTNKDVGELLSMSPRTAQKHVRNIYDKLGIESRAGLALYALEHGLLDASSRH